MRILLIGATGTIGAAVAAALAKEHTVIPVSHSKGDLTVDLSSPDSIRALLGKVGPVDAVVSAAGNAAFKPLAELEDGDFDFSLRNKLMGQVNLIRFALDQVATGGSITVTGGVLAHLPMQGGAAISMVNAALEGFVRGSALEAPRGIRVNLVSPPWVTETLEKLGMDAGGGMPAAVVARAYVSAVAGKETGKVIEPSK
jgi:NAD(P)-dependent dehydrogenase (short-subunit alcohol dehydrogenase family)